MTLGMSLVVLGPGQRLAARHGPDRRRRAGRPAHPRIGLVPRGSCPTACWCSCPLAAVHPAAAATDRLRPAAVRGRRQPRRRSPGRCARRGRSSSCCTSSRRSSPRSPASSIPGLNNVASVTLVDSAVLPSVAAAVIGGTSIMGGRGGYGGTIVGALILTVLTSLLTSLGLPEAVRQILFGAIIVVVAAAYTRVTARILTTCGTARRRSRHLGLDLGGTNIKWVVGRAGRRRPGDRLDRGQVATPVADGSRGRRGPRLGVRRCGGDRAHSRASRRSAIGVPGLYDPADRHDAVPRQHPGGMGRAARGRARSATALGVPAALINDARAFGLAELRLGAARGRLVDGRADARHRHRRRHRDRRPRPPRATTARAASSATRRSTRMGRRAAAATAAAWRPSPGPTGSPRPAGPRPPRRPSAAARAGDPAAVAGLAADRALPRHRDRQHDRGRHSGRGRHRRRHLGRVRPADRARSRRSFASGSTRPRSIACESCQRSSGRGPARIGAAIHGAETAERHDPGGGPRAGRARDDRGGRTTQPHYRLIEQALRERISTLVPGARLPSDAELCAEFGVSRMTARNAMQRLAEDGSDHAQAGPRQLRRRAAGAPPRQSAHDVHARRCAAPGGFPARSVLDPRRPPGFAPPRPTASASPTGQPVVYLRRLRLADGVPMALESTVLDRRAAPTP